jgi:hypothetical protein
MDKVQELDEEWAIAVFGAECLDEDIVVDVDIDKVAGDLFLLQMDYLH